jgi:hypothetical protein
VLIDTVARLLDDQRNQIYLVHAFIIPRPAEFVKSRCDTESCCSKKQKKPAKLAGFFCYRIAAALYDE